MFCVRKTKQLAGILRRFAADKRGNTLAMVAAGLVPMAGMIGGGVDISRAYMVQTRLQQACDAGVLAGRKAMSNSTYNAAAKQQAENFFKTNFPEGYLRTQNLTFTHSNPSGTAKVVGEASVTLPTVIMKIFDQDGIDVDVECEAVMEIANSDITFVLDTTGSMNDNVSTGSGGTIKKIVALRNAMGSFDDTVRAAAAGSNSRIRYAMVPYSITVNVGELIYDLDKTYLIGGTAGDTYAYESRQRPTSGPTLEATFYESQASLDGSECKNKFGTQNSGISGWWQPSWHGYSSGNPVTQGGKTYVFSYYSWNGSTSNPPSYANGSSYWRDCVRKVQRYGSGGSSDWIYKEYNLEVDDFVDSIKSSNPAVPNPAADSGTSRWNGCIEERQTIASSSISWNASGKTITPAGTFDLDIDLVPNNNNQRWRPAWSDVVYYRSSGTTQSSSGTKVSGNEAACPLKSQLLTEMSEAAFDAYIAALGTSGYTYHDIGMLWGARVSSTSGIFQDNVNSPPPNNGFVSRHLIFMTDGDQVSQDTAYTAYGVERHDQRVGGGANNSTTESYHIDRLLAICSAIKARGIRLWIIGFDVDLDNSKFSHLNNCASTGSAYEAENAASLNSAFTEIAAAVADLRLSE